MPSLSITLMQMRRTDAQVLVAVMVVSKPKLLVAGVFDAIVKDNLTAKVAAGSRVWLA
jgi:hypothetical protein